jgi:Domain of unknown function (DUF5666)
MKYKRQIATGALALSLLIGGSSVFAATPQDLGIKKLPPVYQKQSKNSKSVKVKSKGNSNIVGAISSINGSSFMVDIKNIKAKTTTSVDVSTNSLTTYSKNGITATVSDLAVGQKVIVVGTLDKTTNTITAKKVKIV